METQPLLNPPRMAQARNNSRNAQPRQCKMLPASVHQSTISIIATCSVLMLLLLASTTIYDLLSDTPKSVASSIARRKVPLEAHIMSKCPDARDCLHDLILPAMQLVSDDVDFRLSFIGSETHDDDGVLCKHGPSECLGNMLELCAADLHPDPKVYLGFVMCLTRDYPDIPEEGLVEDCALEHGIAVNDLNSCAFNVDENRGLDMLKASFNRSAAAGVTKSCTVRLNDKIRCIRDDGKWKECTSGHAVDDLVRDIRNGIF